MRYGIKYINDNDKKTIIFRPERHFLDSIVDLDHRLEDSTINIQGDKFKQI